MAPTRKYPSGYLKRQKKRKVEELIQSKKGAIDRFFLKEKEPESSVDDLITEQQDDNDKLVDDLGNDEIDDDLDENDNHEDAPIVTDQPSESIPSNIYDPQIWIVLIPNGLICWQKKVLQEIYQLRKVLKINLIGVLMQLFTLDTYPMERNMIEIG